jgi:peptidyl-prolyl cis-trans isomerase B (cyclophilin B)
MKKVFFVFAVSAILLSGCATGQNNLVLNEKNIPENTVNNDDSGLTKDVSKTESYATGNEKQATDEASNASAQEQAQATEQSQAPADTQAQNDLKINEKTTNMNIAVITTNKGVIKVKLNPEAAPISVENFKNYASAGFYSNTVFHRVIPGFMIQGGGFDKAKTEKTTNAPIKIESNNGLKNNRGTIAMARTMVPDSATSQFFINLKDNDFLNYTSPDTQGYGYAVFGEVTEGMDVVDKIAAVKTGDNGSFQDWPVDEVVIESVKLQAE